MPTTRRAPYATNHIDSRRAKLDAPDPQPTRKPTIRARKEVYEKFRAHTDEVRERLISIIRDPESDNGHAIAAGKEILLRGWGAVPNTTVIEALFTHQHVINVDALRQMPQDQLNQLESTLARLVRTADEAEVVEQSDDSDS